MDVKIIIADDHAVLRDGLKMALHTENSFRVIAETDNGLKAVELTSKLKPDIVILDVNMPELNGIETAKEIKKLNPEVKILMLTMYEDEDYILESYRSGIDGYIFKMADMEEFLLAVRTIAGGKNYFHSIASNVILGKMKEQKTLSDAKRPTLTKRESEIVKLIVDGYTSQEIAEKLFISYFTVGKHRKNILAKLNLKNTAELVRYCLERKFFQ